MKKIIPLVLSLLTFLYAFSAMPLTAGAASADMDLFDYLLEATEDFKSQVNIASYVKKNNWTMEDIKAQLKCFYLSEPKLFYVNREVRILYNAEYTKVYLDFTYDYSREQVDSMRKQMKNAAEEAIEGITEDMSDAEKALWVHDYLVLNCSYDHSESKYSAYDCLVGKSSVCQGYSLAFMYIMRDLLGMECTVVFSDSQNHSWNYLKIGNYWYHVDVTSDDPSYVTIDGDKYDGKGEVLHENLLLSDDAVYKSSGLHRSWNTIGKPKASSKKFDNFFWCESTSAMYRINGLWYYTVLDKGSPGANYVSGGSNNIYSKLCTFNYKTRKSSTLKNISSVWSVFRNPDTGEMIDGNSWYKKSYMKLVQIGEYLYFNTAQRIYRYDPETNKMKKIYSLEKDGMQIFSIVSNGEKSIQLIYKKDLSFSDKSLRLKIS